MPVLRFLPAVHFANHSFTSRDSTLILVNIEANTQGQIMFLVRLVANAQLPILHSYPGVIPLISNVSFFLLLNFNDVISV